MVTVHREGGFRVVIFTDDHLPAHVHIYGDGVAKIELVGADGEPELVFADDMKRGDIRKAMRIVTEQRDFLLDCWSKIHG
jgi:histidinol phosphatase-like PHP family hydrolase